MNIKTIKFDINKKLYDTITAKQGDTQSRFLFFNLLDGAIPFSLENRNVRVYAIKPDGTEVFNDLIVTDAVKGYCILELTNQMLAVAGTVKLELMVIENEKKLTSNIFFMDVKESINSENSIVSTNEFTALLNGLASLNEYDNYKNEIKAARGGQPNLKARLDKVDSDMDTKANKSEIGSPLIANSISEMIDKTRVYVNTTDKNWYCWNGSAWVIGGVYNSQGIGERQVDYNMTTFFRKSVNLINENNVTKGYQISLTDGLLVANSNYTTTDFIEVTSDNSMYIFSNAQNSVMRFRGHYDANKQYISGGENYNNFSTSNTKIKYIRITYASTLTNVQFEKGTIATEYVKYGEIKKYFPIYFSDILGFTEINKSRLNGKKIAFLGDSISDENSSLASQIEKYYYRYIEANTGCSIYMHGVAGTGFNVRNNGNNSVNDRVENIPTDADYIVVFAGTNDWGIDNGTPLGNIQDYLSNNTNPYSSLYAAIGNTIEKLVARFPFGKIVFITPLPRWDKGSSMLHGANARGFTLRQVAKAIIELCEWWSIPVLDLNAKSNICTNGSTATGPVYYLDGLHPNTKGNRDILAPKIQSFLETI